MRGKSLNLAIFLLSFIFLIISMKLFCNMGVYVDEVSTSPDIVLGGSFWLYMYWLRLGALGIITVLSGLSLRSKSK